MIFPCLVPTVSVTTTPKQCRLGVNGSQRLRKNTCLSVPVDLPRRPRPKPSRLGANTSQLIPGDTCLSAQTRSTSTKTLLWRQRQFSEAAQSYQNCVSRSIIFKGTLPFLLSSRRITALHFLHSSGMPSLI